MYFHTSDSPSCAWIYKIQLILSHYLYLGPSPKRLAKNLELLDLSSPRADPRVCPSPHRRRDSHSALRETLLLLRLVSVPARITKQRCKRVQWQIMRRPRRGDFCQRPYRYLGLPFVLPAWQRSASISTMREMHAADNAYLWHNEQVPTGLPFHTNLVQAHVIVDTVEG